jgi:hypothetical protein
MRADSPPANKQVIAISERLFSIPKRSKWQRETAYKSKMVKLFSQTPQNSIIKSLLNSI